jgi:cyclopropane fatty-acyl-phospholipid synthase-like methyltransferase
VAWLTGQLPNRDCRVLDLGCGPGLYTHRLAQRGHRCTGLDFSPASIEYAKQHAAQDNLNIKYELNDIRRHEIAGKFDLAMMVFGEFNVFRKPEIETILAKVCASLENGGRLVVEVHSFEEVKSQGQAPASWQSLESGLFSERPHLLLQEQFWNEASATAVTRYLIVETQSNCVVEYGSTMQAYSTEEYRRMFEAAGMSKVRQLDEPEWPAGDGLTGKLQVFTGEKTAR